MPTYEYACRACGHVFEIVQKMSDDPLVICPECGGELRKVFAPPAIAFKGSGFYATDHGKQAKPAKADGGETKDPTPTKEKEGSTSSGTKGEGSSSPKTDGSSGEYSSSGSSSSTKDGGSS